MCFMKKQNEVIDREFSVADERGGKSFTKWENLTDAGIVPTNLYCQDYLPYHRVDMSCHSGLPFDVEVVKSHLAPQHNAGGGFSVSLRQSDGRKSKFWDALRDNGIELLDFRCDVCDEELPLIGRKIAQHFRAHVGKSRMARQGGKFWMTLSLKPLEIEEEDIG